VYAVRSAARTLANWRRSPLPHPSAALTQLHGVSVYEAIKNALRREGVRGLYKGVGAVAAGAGCVGPSGR